ncbi:protein of unknown function [Methylocaldum szegediense]|uniref:Uncharacterized protein n=1 Tax=Methylocaldum szegediense TaxID=73780 RepID=A0ABM9I6C3_9GAMM|nr:protein of unknown function [Methylocaldum szegediense]
MRQAEGADDESKTTHLIYLSEAKVESARATAETRKADTGEQHLRDEREKLRLRQRLPRSRLNRARAVCWSPWARCWSSMITLSSNPAFDPIFSKWWRRSNSNRIAMY